MNRLAPNLFDRRFGDLIEVGRSRLPSLAPAWTDHNAHDPGIMLMELLAWVAEAQIYSLARTRRDERGAYAALMGLAPGGTVPARGLIWPDHDDPNSPAAMIASSFVIERDNVVRTSKSDVPTFRPMHRIRWIPARIRALQTHLANGGVVDHSGANRRGGPAFQPFGNTASRRDVLSMELEATGDMNLPPSQRPEGARLVIGVQALSPQAARSDTEEEPPTTRCMSPLEVTLFTEMDSYPLEVVEDTSDGFLRTGVCVLDLSRVQGLPKKFTLTFRAPRGFDRPPRVLRIEPNVVPISQGKRVERELHDARGLPDQYFDLDVSGLQFVPGTEPVMVEVSGGGGFARWQRVELLSDSGPDDRVFELDAAAARITFGNGINGQMPAAGAQVFLSYSVCDGTGGNTARNRTWIVQGVSGVFGVNLDPIAGGADPAGFIEHRREARRRLKHGHALVSPADIEAAARALVTLEVGRAWVVPPGPRAIETGTVTLIALRARPDGIEPDAIPETPRWLEAIRRRLASRLPLGSRLVVAGPRYVEFTIRSRVEAEPGRDPVAVKKAVEVELRKRLALVSASPESQQRAFGLPVTRRDLAAWIQALPEVRRAELRIILANRKADDEVKIPRHGLPKIDLAQSTIEVVRGAPGGSR